MSDQIKIWINRTIGIVWLGILSFQSYWLVRGTSDGNASSHALGYIIALIVLFIGITCGWVGTFGLLQGKHKTLVKFLWGYAGIFSPYGLMCLLGADSNQQARYCLAQGLLPWVALFFVQWKMLKPTIKFKTMQGRLKGISAGNVRDESERV